MANRWLVVGLGNPGPKYEKTRHNIGQLVLNLLSSNQKFSLHKSRMEISEVQCAGENLVLAKSLGYMNEYGAPTRALADFYKIPLEQIIIIHDELDLPFNTLRIKLGGGDNGHNGLKSISRSLGSPDYHRIRMGIGRPHKNQDAAKFVLKSFSKDEVKLINSFIQRGAEASKTLISKGLDYTQNLFNS
jgi:PTH1 family peptidyl-tRNA hydrolase